MRIGPSVALAVLLVGSAQPAPAGREESGERLYRIYCANCHGESGRGDGVTAEVLKIRPTDLTRLTDAGGGWPAHAIVSAIDGRRRVAGHGRSRMPIWGLAFQQSELDVNQEAEVRVRIQRLVDYLKTLQQARPVAEPVAD